MHTEGLLPYRENCDVASDPARLLGNHCALVNNINTSGRQRKTVWSLRSRPVQLAVLGRSQLVAGAQRAMAAGWEGIPVGYEVHAALQAQRGHAAWTDGKERLKNLNPATPLLQGAELHARQYRAGQAQLWYHTAGQLKQARCHNTGKSWHTWLGRVSPRQSLPPKDPAWLVC